MCKNKFCTAVNHTITDCYSSPMVWPSGGTCKIKTICWLHVLPKLYAKNLSQAHIIECHYILPVFSCFSAVRCKPKPLKSFCASMGISYLDIELTLNTSRTLKSKLCIRIFMFWHMFESFQASSHRCCVYAVFCFPSFFIEVVRFVCSSYSLLFFLVVPSCLYICRHSIPSFF